MHLHCEAVESAVVAQRYVQQTGLHALFRGVLCGVVWLCRGVVWCGVVWCGVVWCGVVWGVRCGAVWCGVVCDLRCDVVWCGVMWFNAV